MSRSRKKHAVTKDHIGRKRERRRRRRVDKYRLNVGLDPMSPQLVLNDSDVQASPVKATQNSRVVNHVQFILLESDAFHSRDFPDCYDEIAILVDGVNLLEHLESPGMMIPNSATFVRTMRGLKRVSSYMVEVRMASPEESLFYVCTCGHIGCGYITGTIEVTPHEVIWSDFTGYSHRFKGVFRFDRRQYEEQLDWLELLMRPVGLS